MEFGGWRAHFRRFPWDSTDRLLAHLIAMQCADPRPTDAELRPWAYTHLEVVERERARVDTKEREERARRALGRIGGGLNWWRAEG